jgi:hypothetical protein
LYPETNVHEFRNHSRRKGANSDEYHVISPESGEDEGKPILLSNHEVFLEFWPLYLIREYLPG